MTTVPVNKNHKIAFFDSGIGGLTVLKEMLILAPAERYIYFADHLNNPYGIKSPDVVKTFINSAVEFLVSKNIKMLVIACNTATAISIDYLRSKYNFNIVGMEPAIKMPINQKLEKKVLLLATSLTLKSQRLNDLIKKLYTSENQVIKLPADQLVRFAENFNFTSKEVYTYIEDLFRGINLNGISAIVLGCTHFIYFKPIIQKIINNTTISLVDGNYGTALNSYYFLKKNNLLSNNTDCAEIEFYGTNGLSFSKGYEDKLKYSLEYLNTFN